MTAESKRLPLRTAIIGCGAVTEKKHLPILLESSKVDITLLVDPNEERLTYLCDKYNIRNRATDIKNIEKYADLAIVAVPHHVHSSIAVSLLEKGIHVFIEKPLATSLNEANMMIDAARKNNRKICVGLIRRYYPSFNYVQEVLSLGWLGDIQFFDFREGGIYNWPAASDTFFRKDTGGGVLLDTGAHTIDTLLSWLGGYEAIEYFDDSRGGVEANCLMRLTLKNGVKGIIELSRTRNLRNTCIIKGSNGEIEVGVGYKSPIILRTNNLEVQGIPEDRDKGHLSIKDLGRLQAENFINAILNEKKPPVSAESSLETIRLFEECRESRKQLDLPWEEYKCEVNFSQFDNKRILVLGGTGFVGGRLIEVLTQKSSAKVRVLIRNYSRLSHIARYPLEIVHGDIKDRAALSQAMKGCDFVFNCTYGKGSKAEQVQVNITAVKDLIEEAARHKVAKVVHISTVSVYGNIADGVITEEINAQVSKDDMYGYTKMKGEKAALEMSKRLGLPLTVIQPTVIYGPGAPSWTLNTIRMLKSGRIILIDGGNGLSNVVYIDDLISALLLAALSDKASGEKLLISGTGPVTWKDFYGAFEEILGMKSTVSMSSEELNNYRQIMRRKSSTIAQIKRLIREEYSGNPRIIELPLIAGFRSIVKSFVSRKTIENLKSSVVGKKDESEKKAAGDNKPIHLFSEYQEAFYKSRASVNINKTTNLIGYNPKYNFTDGMKITSQWIRWANLL